MCEGQESLNTVILVLCGYECDTETSQGEEHPPVYATDI